MGRWFRVIWDDELRYRTMNSGRYGMMNSRMGWWIHVWDDEFTYGTTNSERIQVWDDEFRYGMMNSGMGWWIDGCANSGMGWWIQVWYDEFRYGMITTGVGWWIQVWDDETGLNRVPALFHKNVGYYSHPKKWVEPQKITENPKMSGSKLSPMSANVVIYRPLSSALGVLVVLLSQWLFIGHCPRRWGSGWTVIAVVIYRPLSSAQVSWV